MPMYPAIWHTHRLHKQAGAAMGGVMGFVYGLLCLATGIGMVMVARPRYGKTPAILSGWVVGQSYVLAILMVTVIGFALIAGALPALHW
jgi:hypothetical protein